MCIARALRSSAEAILRERMLEAWWPVLRRLLGEVERCLATWDSRDIMRRRVGIQQIAGSAGDGVAVAACERALRFPGSASAVYAVVVMC